MVKKLLLHLLAALAIILSGLAVRHFMFAPAPADTGVRALFAARFADPTGHVQPMAQWKGKLLVVNFWATWCAPCLDEMPELSALQTSYRDRNLAIVGITSDSLAEVRDFQRSRPVSYTLLSGDVDAMNLSEILGNDKSVLPFTAIITPRGELVKTHFGRVNRALLEQTLVPLLASESRRGESP